MHSREKPDTNYSYFGCAESVLTVSLFLTYSLFVSFLFLTYSLFGLLKVLRHFHSLHISSVQITLSSLLAGKENAWSSGWTLQRCHLLHCRWHRYEGLHLRLLFYIKLLFLWHIYTDRIVKYKFDARKIW